MRRGQVTIVFEKEAHLDWLLELVESRAKGGTTVGAPGQRHEDRTAVRRACSPVETVARKPSSQIIENSRKV